MPNIPTSELNHFSSQGRPILILRQWWPECSTNLLRLAIAIMAILVVVKLGDEYRRLVWATDTKGPLI